MKVYCFSDSHGSHELLSPYAYDDTIDIIIFAGDATNNRSTSMNHNEFIPFFNWFIDLPIKHKVFIAGNHDTCIEAGMVTPQNFKDNGIHYLYNSGVGIEGIKIWGSPFTPSYGNWSFMKSRGKLAPIWNLIPEGLDILVTHGPPHGILDLTINREGKFEQVGDKELWREVVKKKPKYHIFGHIHDYATCKNQGALRRGETVFINASVVEDGKLGRISSNGVKFEI